MNGNIFLLALHSLLPLSFLWLHPLIKVPPGPVAALLAELVAHRAAVPVVVAGDVEVAGIDRLANGCATRPAVSDPGRASMRHLFTYPFYVASCLNQLLRNCNFRATAHRAARLSGLTLPFHWCVLCIQGNIPKTYLFVLHF